MGHFGFVQLVTENLQSQNRTKKGINNKKDTLYKNPHTVSIHTQER